jgi:hypothetical protein
MPPFRVLKSPHQVLASVILTGVAAVTIALPNLPLGWVPIIVADGYLLAMVWSAAVMSADGSEAVSLPMRESAVLIVPLLFATFVLAFAAAYRYHQPSLGPLDAVYSSFINFGSFTYDVTTESDRGRLATSVQMVSGILLLICGLPLLISRLADLDRIPVHAKPTSVRVRLRTPDGAHVAAIGAQVVSSETAHEVEIIVGAPPTTAPTSALRATNVKAANQSTPGTKS